MPEIELVIRRSHAGVVECHASAPALDALPALPGVHACRVAPDELLLLAVPSRIDEILGQATAHLAGAEPGALVVDQSDGWTVFSLPGDEGMLALRQLSVIAFPTRRPAFVQGAVAGGPAKLLLLPGGVHLLVPFALRDHLERRLREVCAAPPARIDASDASDASEAPFAPFSGSAP